MSPQNRPQPPNPAPQNGRRRSRMGAGGPGIGGLTTSNSGCLGSSALFSLFSFFSFFSFLRKFIKKLKKLKKLNKLKKADAPTPLEIGANETPNPAPTAQPGTPERPRAEPKSHIKWSFLATLISLSKCDLEPNNPDLHLPHNNM